MPQFMIISGWWLPPTPRVRHRLASYAGRHPFGVDLPRVPIDSRVRSVDTTVGETAPTTKHEHDTGSRVVKLGTLIQPEHLHWRSLRNPSNTRAVRGIRYVRREPAAWLSRNLSTRSVATAAAHGRTKQRLAPALAAPPDLKAKAKDTAPKGDWVTRALTQTPDPADEFYKGRPTGGSPSH